MLRAGLVGLAIASLPAGAPAHPHVFIDGGVDFVFDAAGRLSALRIVWIYDPLTSMFMLEDLGIDPSSDLAPDARADLAAYQTEWDPGYDGDSYLWDGDRRVGLSGPRSAAANLVDGRVEIRFLRAIETPFRPEAGTIAKIYDPTYYTAYFVTETPRLEGAADGCRARVTPYTPSAPLAALQQRLSDIAADEDPADPDVGALFADQVHLTCG